MTEPRPASFVHGVLAGFGGVLVLIQLVLANDLRGVEGMYREFGDIHISALTKLTLSPAWLWGMPLVGAAAIVGLLIRRPRSLVLYVALAAVLAAATIMTWYYPRAPIYALAGNIQP